MTFDAEAAELEDGGEAEPDDHAEEDWLPVVLLDVAPAEGHQPQAGLGPVFRAGRLSRAARSVAARTSPICSPRR